MVEKNKPEELLTIGNAIREECIRTALEAYESASLSGLCRKGAWECAIDAMKNLKIEDILKQLNK